MVVVLFQIIISILLIFAILLQSQGSGLSNAFGGGGELYRSKRSLEKVLVYVTAILALFFAVASIILLIPR